MALDVLRVVNEELRAQYEELEAAAGEREAERRRYLELFELAPDAYLVTDRRQRIIEANQAAARILVPAGTPLLGRRLTTFVPLDERRRFRSRLGELAGAATISGWRLRFQPCHREPVPVSVTVGHASDQQGEHVGYRWLIRDESATEEVRQALDESESRYQAIVETAADAILTIDAAGKVATMNPAASRLFGYPADEVIGRNVKMLMPEPWRDEHDGYLARYRRTGERRIIGIGREARGRRKDGSTFPIELAVSEFHDRVGPMFAGVIRDLTARKAREEELRLFAQMVSASGDLVAFVDRDYVFRAVNDACAAVLGLPRADIVGRPVAEVLGPEYFESAVKPKLAESLAGSPVHFEAWRELGPGIRRYLEVRFFAHRDETGAITGVVVDARDRTETKRLQEEIEHHRSDLAHVARLSTLGELAAGLAHELNQPLTAIASYCDGMARLVERNAIALPVLVETLAACSAQAQRAGDIIRRLRTHTRRDRAKRETVDVNELVTNVLRLVNSEAQLRGVAIDTDFAHDLPPVWVDRIQIEQVILNLVHNGIEAIDAARVEVRRVSIRTHREGAGVEVGVEDTGSGLSPEIARKLFDPFFTTKEGGMGVGLSICRTIIEAHGGRLGAQNRPAGGTRAFFTLPASDEEQAR